MRDRIYYFVFEEDPTIGQCRPPVDPAVSRVNHLLHTEKDVKNMYEQCACYDALSCGRYCQHRWYAV